MINQSKIKRSARISAILLCLILTAALVAPFTASAKSAPKTVRVGWYESSFNTTDSSGRRSGYAYEYQMKIAAYAGWNYTYVTGSWSDLMQMLIDGKIDMMSDVSYTDERSEKMLFSELPMGTEEYYVFISSKNHTISSEDYSTLNGKRIGVNKGSIQIEFFNSWARQHDISAELVELSGTEANSQEKLNSGKLDAFITLNAFVDSKNLVPVCKIGSSDFYFAVSSSRPDLLSDLNKAMNSIQDEDPYYNQSLYEKFIKRHGSNAYLDAQEQSWLSSHGPIRVGYQNNYLAFCSQDPDTGELKGMLKDYLEYASGCIENAHISFEAKAYPTVQAAFEAMSNDEIDCVFPANLSSYDGEIQNILITPVLMRTDVYAIVRQSDKKTLSDKERVVVAVNEGNPNYNAFLQENFPDWMILLYPTTADCLKAVSDGMADCVLISSSRYNNILRLCDNYNLTYYDTGVGLDYCFAAEQGDNELYSILSKIVEQVPESTVNAALSYYIAEDSKITLTDFITDNIGPVMMITTIVVLVFVLLFMQSRRAEITAKNLISATETDTLTGLYNRDYFFEYADRMFRENPDTPRDAIVLNIEHFHSINALNGWEFGNRVLRALGSEIFIIAKEFDGIGGRFGADRFDIYCRHIENYEAVFERFQNKLDFIATNVSVSLRMGVMPWQPKIEPIQLFDRARTACNMARGHYMEHLIIFDEEVHKRELFDQQLLNDLRSALDNLEFEVYYQPKFDISVDPPRLAGAEALVRWQHPTMGLLTPDSFISLFERNGKIKELDKYVWAHAANQIAIWQDKYKVTVPVSVNLSRVDIFDSELENILDDILKSTGLERSAIELEVTESAYTENSNQLVLVTKNLHRKGFTIEMDDFGTGYSSLNMLSSMPIDVLKLDKSFIRNIENSKKDVQMVSLVLDIAKNLNMRVIVEGVETASQMNILKELGCELIQGHYLSQPLHPSEFESEYLK